MAVDYTSVTLKCPGQMLGTPVLEYAGKQYTIASDGTVTVAPMSSASVAAYLAQGWTLTAFTA